MSTKNQKPETDSDSAENIKAILQAIVLYIIIVGGILLFAYIATYVIV
jgi:hypothetical protein